MKALTKLLAAILGLALALMVIARLLLGVVVGSESFRTLFNDQVERALHSFLPTLMSETKQIEMDGLANVLVSDLTIRNSRKISATLPLKRVLVSPELASTLMSETFHIEIETMFGEYGRINFHATAPKWLLRNDPHESPHTGAVRLEGSAIDLDGVVISNLLFPDDAAPGFYLSKGLLSGTVQFSKPLGLASKGSKKAGRFLGSLKDSVWILSEDNNRPLLVNKMALNLELIEHTILIRSPVAIEGTSGSALITGAIDLPGDVADDAVWDLVVQVDNDQGLSASLAKLFKCKDPPQGSRYSVKGPVTGSICKS